MSDRDPLDPETDMNRLIIAAALLAACAGCNMVSGLGKDLQNVGGAIAGTAEGVQRGMTPGTERAPPTTTEPGPLCAPDASGAMPPGCPA
jgi:predicted small secreted protein